MAEYNLWLEVKDLTKKLDAAIADMRQCGQQLAAAEREYKIQLRETALALKRGGMAVGMIQLTIYGYEEVAKLREKRDVADAFYQAAREAALSYKLQIRVVNDQLSREMSTPQASY